MVESGQSQPRLIPRRTQPQEAELPCGHFGQTTGRVGRNDHVGEVIDRVGELAPGGDESGLILERTETGEKHPLSHVGVGDRHLRPEIVGVVLQRQRFEAAIAALKALRLRALPFRDTFNNGAKFVEPVGLGFERGLDVAHGVSAFCGLLPDAVFGGALGCAVVAIVEDGGSD